MMPSLLATALLGAVTAAPSVPALRWEKRVLLVSAPRPDDPRLEQQRRIMARWRAGAAERDLVTVEIAGESVVGASDSATVLRRRYRLPPDRFIAMVIGKDGGSKLRRSDPITADTLTDLIDSMPMRRAGGR